ncbi:MAG: single-stranded-DNA-specific exonuclease RecJ [Gammaproteobacteria bacterium]|nr:single-stranded-DNA-specific exonuclease RecJ [Gammaproteobacteria bacterium]MBU6508841.1 single-stranded-DNA-specific exonuclease RecJ [Gammaproteobacteria bacterium]MDE1983117.1 single-stranded-DNA-specific exonuclease RecJ [Gammaproteobacteria bacterium]MDE2108335.1 single-stranded-DNA-specific exonuclease RecJ [Gammaproteobacteria bacterium]
MTPRRIERRALAADAALPDSVPPLLRRIYAARGVLTVADLDTALGALLDFRSLHAMPDAVALLAECLRSDACMLIVGDFDADGATSSALGVRGLRAFGAQHVDYLVPNRFEYGYGLTPEIVAIAAQRKPQLIITVDNGISSHAGIAAAHAAGIRVLVTDHHLPGAALPEADVILNPNLPGDAFPSKSLAGVGVMFYLLLALRAHLRDVHWFVERGIPEPNLAEFLDIVALGTVADLVPLDHNNRVLVAQGLTRIRAGRCVSGIRALLQIGKRELHKATAVDLGFAVAPRLNAAGRLTDMSLGIECLLADDEARARELAVRLDALNHERRAIEAQMRDEALRMIEQMSVSADDAVLPFGLCLFNTEWHQGVIGLVASRIKDRVHRPVVAFARAEAGQLKGSARSVKGVHIRDVLEAVNTRHPGLIAKFGGHAMAAGLNLAEAQFPQFAEAFDKEVRCWLEAADLDGVLHTDGELAPEDLTLACAELLRSAGPWGQAFPEPCFDGVFGILERRIVGNGHVKFTLAESRSHARVDAIAFHPVAEQLPLDCQQVRMVYRPEVNEYRGEQRLQLLVEYIEPVVP